ncbi:MAG: single-stranded-DNA-specific exonuclease RecJ [Planctomycetaceae bacterium]|nr:single-stranded-DNA-specific exonuclease RecJ [Planctomycetaceae bacterium]
MTRWRVAPHDRAAIGRLCQELKCAPLLAQILAARGVPSGAAAQALLSTNISELSDPDTLPGAAAAAERIVAAVRAGRRITIYGDYDVDGITATSILWRCLKLAGAQVDYYIPCRFEEGYGLNSEALRQLHAEDPQRLLITVDCGIASLAEARVARELGLELIVTDHHTFAEELPDVDVVVHPRLPGHASAFEDLCGAGVAFKVAWRVCQILNADENGETRKVSPRMREFLKSAVALAAMGTVGDVVPLRSENRIIVCYGLKAIRETPHSGLTQLLEVAGLKDKQTLTAEDIGFSLAPRINAAGRLGQSRLAVELLTTDNEQRAAQIATHFDELNKTRQSVERKMFKQARELIEADPALAEQAVLVIAHPEWHVGVVGIVAGRIAEQYARPAIMIALDEQKQTGQGSARTHGGFDLHAALTACREHLERFGGHRAAAGLHVRKETIDAFRTAIVEYAASNRDAPDHAPAVNVDAEVQLGDLTHRAVRELERLGPFGAEHGRPVLMTSRVELVEPPKKMGGGERHLSLRVRQGNSVLRCVAFGKGDWADEIAACDAALSICFSPSLNSFNGYENVELQLIGWQPAAKAPELAAAGT